MAMRMTAALLLLQCAQPATSVSDRVADQAESADAAGSQIANYLTVRALPGRLSALSTFRSKSSCMALFVWGRRACDGPFRPVPALAVP
jgi:hypothetical protein